MKVYKKYITCLVLLMTFNVMAQQSLSLSEAVSKGLEQNYQIRIASDKLRIADNNNSWGMAGIAPQLSIGASQRNRFDENNQIKGTTWQSSPFIQMNWTLFNGCSVYVNKNSLAALESLSEGYVTLVVENSLQAIILAYYQAVLQKEQLEVRRQVLSLSADRFRYVKEQKDFGTAVTFDLLQARNNYLSDSSAYLQQELVCHNALRNLSLLMADSVEVDYRVTDSLSMPLLVFDYHEVKSKMLRNNRALQNQYINQQLLENESMLKSRKLYPVVNMTAGYDKGYQTITPEGAKSMYSESYDYFANFTLSFNLFNGGRTRKAIQNAAIEEQIGTIELDELKHSLINRLYSIYKTLEIKESLVFVAYENKSSAALNLELAAERFRSGAINSFNYRDIQQMYLSAAMLHTQSIYNWWEAYIEMLRMSGTIIDEVEKR